MNLLLWFQPEVCFYKSYKHCLYSLFRQFTFFLLLKYLINGSKHSFRVFFLYEIIFIIVLWTAYCAVRFHLDVLTIKMKRLNEHFYWFPIENRINMTDEQSTITVSITFSNLFYHRNSSKNSLEFTNITSISSH